MTARLFNIYLLFYFEEYKHGDWCEPQTHIARVHELMGAVLTTIRAIYTIYIKIQLVC